jgi:asparagine synthetase B (glutamine-hydrolysing)
MTLEKQLKKSVYCQMLFDVPLGAFLSGGVDNFIIDAKSIKQTNQNFYSRF